MAEFEVTLRRSNVRRRWRVKYGRLRRRNDLSPAVGLLEFSNALDFAANVWNSEPPPTIAMVFMALGATGALIILAFAVFDLPRAWHNIALLRQERRELISLQNPPASELGNATPTRLSEKDIQIHLDLNHRELGNEVIDRFAMGLLLGFGALTVGIGTYLAIDGANPTSFLASNIITGYVGNVPAALFGILNAAWCVYGWRRAQRHANAAVNILGKGSREIQDAEMSKEIQRHSKRIKLHAAINGIDALLGGAGSLMTASAYIKPVGVWGYVILLPAAITALALNLFWRKGLNYERECVTPWSVESDKILNDAGHILEIERLLSRYRPDLYNKNKRFQQKHKDFDGNSLQNFLTDYYTITTESLAREVNRLTSKLESLACEKTEDERQVIAKQRVQLDADLTTIQTQIDRSNAWLFRLRATTVSLEKQPNSQDLLEPLYDLLLTTDLFPYLCMAIANDSSTTLLLGKDLATAKELKINSSVLQQRLTDRSGLTGPFLNLACQMLVDKGVKHIRSRVRYYCELGGCTLSRRTPESGQQEPVGTTTSKDDLDPTPKLGIPAKRSEASIEVSAMQR